MLGINAFNFNRRGNKWEAIILRSQIFSTINSNRPQVSYLRISNPLEYDYKGDELEDVGTTFEHSSRADDDRFYYQPGEVGTMPSDRSIHLSLEEYNRILAEYKDSIYIPSLTRIH